MKEDGAASRLKAKIVRALMRPRSDLSGLPAEIGDILAELPELVVESEQDTARREHARVARAVGASVDKSLQLGQPTAYLTAIRLLDLEELLAESPEDRLAIRTSQVGGTFERAKLALLKVSIEYDLSTRSSVDVSLTIFLVRDGRPVRSTTEWQLPWDEVPQHVRERQLRSGEKLLVYEIYSANSDG